MTAKKVLMMVALIIAYMAVWAWVILKMMAQPFINLADRALNGVYEFCIDLFCPDESDDFDPGCRD